MSDTQLQQAVLEELDWEPSITASHIGVAAKAGVVTLTGHVANLAEKSAAELAARRVKGVHAVVEELDVQLPDGRQRQDDEIAKVAADHLAWNASLPDEAVKATVEKGWITLTGRVDWNYQRESAKHDVRNLLGVVGLTDLITIAPRVDAADVSDRIQHALKRSWFFDAKTVGVSADGGRIHLTGTVRSWHERNVTADTAWSAPGATAVENDITIV